MKGEFVRFPKINNITMTFDFGEYECWGSEKVDGSNVCVTFDNENLLTFSRNGISMNSDQRLLVAIEPIKERLLTLFKSLNNGENEYHLYGELFGNKVIKRCNYLCMSDIRFFGMRCNGEFLHPEKTRELLNGVGLGDYFLKFHKVESIKDITVPMNSEFTAGGKGVGEGWCVWCYQNGKFVDIIKYKDPAFCDKKSQPIKEISETLIVAKELFGGYITDNRILDTLSKYPKEYNNYGELIKEFMNDCWTDFVKDYPQYNTLQKSDKKLVMKPPKNIYQRFREFQNNR